jgi:hypothetical protein
MNESMNQEIMDVLSKNLIASSTQRIYAVRFIGQTIRMTSGKESWKSIGAAKSALKHELNNVLYYLTEKFGTSRYDDETRDKIWEHILNNCVEIVEVLDNTRR